MIGQRWKYYISLKKYVGWPYSRALMCQPYDIIMKEIKGCNTIFEIMGEIEKKYCLMINTICQYFVMSLIWINYFSSLYSKNCWFIHILAFLLLVVLIARWKSLLVIFSTWQCIDISDHIKSTLTLTEKKKPKKRKQGDSGTSVVFLWGFFHGAQTWKYCKHHWRCSQLWITIMTSKQWSANIWGIRIQAISAGQEGPKGYDWEKYQNHYEKQKTRKTEKEPQHFQQLQNFNYEEDNKSVFCKSESIENKEMSTFSSKWKSGRDKMLVICLNCNR